MYSVLLFSQLNITWIDKIGLRNEAAKFYPTNSFFVADASFVVGSCDTARICDVTRTCWVNRERETNLDPSLRMDTRSHVRGAQTVSNSFFHFVFHFIISFFIIIIVIISSASVSAEKIKLLTDRSATLFLFCRWAILRLNAHNFISFFPFSFLPPQKYYRRLSLRQR